MHSHSPDLIELEAVRLACVRAAVDAYEDAGLRGLCGDGRWEAALDAIRTLDLQAIVAQAHSATVPNPAVSSGGLNRDGTDR